MKPTNQTMHHFIDPLSYETKIAYADTDAGGVVYHANYIEMAERARLDALAQIGYPIKKMLDDDKGCFVVKKLNITYHHTAKLEDTITILTQPIDIKKTSITFCQEFCLKEKSLAILEILLVFISINQWKPIKIPDALSALFIKP
ncbi:MAG: acyl-CoA thioesterase [Alphaproteobacteria bacterium]